MRTKGGFSMTQSTENHKEILFLAGSLFLAVLGDVLFYKKAVGISMPIMVFSTYFLFFRLFRGRLLASERSGWLLLIPIALLSLTFAIFSNPVLLFFNWLGILFLFVVQTKLITGYAGSPWTVGKLAADLVEKVLYDIVANVPVPFKLIQKLVRSGKDAEHPRTGMKILLGLLISFPLLALVIGLLSSADSIFNDWMSRIPELLGDWSPYDWPAHLFLILLFFFVIFGYFWSLHVPKTHSAAEKAKNEKANSKTFVDGIVAVTVLLMINLVYAVFVAIQISYLFGKADVLLPEGVTYSEYARRGFAEINVVTSINLAILLITTYFVNKEQRLAYRMVRLLLTFLTFCTGVMLFSAFFRLYLYEQAYGFTLLRLLAHAFEVLILALIIQAMVKIWKENFPLFKAYFITTLTWYVILNYANIDRVIAEANIMRWERTGQIDIEYLGSLSYDAIPTLVKMRDRSQDSFIRAKISDILDAHIVNLREEDHWQSFSYGRYSARKLLGE
jgi:hypothetical protein